MDFPIQKLELQRSFFAIVLVGLQLIAIAVCGLALPEIFKFHRHTNSEVVNFPTVANRFDELHIDLLGRLPTSEKKKLYCLADLVGPKFFLF